MAGRISSAWGTAKVVGKWAKGHPNVTKVKALGGRAAASARSGTRRVVGSKVYGATMKGKRKYVTGGVIGAAGVGGYAYGKSRKKS